MSKQYTLAIYDENGSQVISVPFDKAILETPQEGPLEEVFAEAHLKLIKKVQHGIDS